MEFSVINEHGTSINNNHFTLEINHFIISLRSAFLRTVFLRISDKIRKCKIYQSKYASKLLLISSEQAQIDALETKTK